MGMYRPLTSDNAIVPGVMLPFTVGAKVVTASEAMIEVFAGPIVASIASIKLFGSD